MGGDDADRGRSVGAGSAAEQELDRQHHLPGDDQRAAPVASSSSVTADRAADRVLQRHQRRVGLAARTASSASGTLRAGVRMPLLGGGDGAQRLLGEGALGAEVDETGRRCSGHARPAYAPGGSRSGRRRPAPGCRSAPRPHMDAADVRAGVDHGSAAGRPAVTTALIRLVERPRARSTAQTVNCQRSGAERPCSTAPAGYVGIPAAVVARAAAITRAAVGPAGACRRRRPRRRWGSAASG